MSTSLPVVAVVGRPNVGKSTLVNRILGRRAAIVEERPGVTRDRREFVAQWLDRDFVLVDTGGWVVTPEDALAADIDEQAEAALAVADVVLLVVDVKAGATDDEGGVVKILRKADRPVIVVANKVDGPRDQPESARLWALGLGQPYEVSALHGRGVGDLLDALIEMLPEASPQPEGDRLPRLAILGRPNVGKSTLLNQLAGEERVLVSPVPGTTRDPIDAVVRLGDSDVQLVDTAGIRRAPRVEDGTEFYSVLRAREAMKTADVALLLIDSLEGVTHQDQRIAEEITTAGAGLVILLNKWDAVDEESRLRTESGIADRLHFAGWAPVLRISAKTGARLHRLAEAVDMVLEHRNSRVSTGQLNRLVRKWAAAHPPPVRAGRRPKIVYAVQAGTAPPTFIVFVGGGELGPDYTRFLENRLRDTFSLEGTPVHIITRKRSRARSA